VALAEHGDGCGGIGFSCQQRHVEGAAIDQDDISDDVVGRAVAEDLIGVEIIGAPQEAGRVGGAEQDGAGEGVEGMGGGPKPTMWPRPERRGLQGMP
jgi:hypothetical protein